MFLNQMSKVCYPTIEFLKDLYNYTENKGDILLN